MDDREDEIDCGAGGSPGAERPRKTPVSCPNCGKESDFFAEPVGPFCSKRCKMADLGSWFNEDYRFSDPLRADMFDEYADLDGPGLDQPEGRG